MYIDQTKYTTRPAGNRIPQEFAIYDRLEELDIPYVRVDHDHADTIEICHQVEQVLGSKICKNLFLCNKQQTDKDLMANEYISGHPGISTSTLQLKREDLLSFVESTGHPPVYVDLPDPRKEEP